MRKVGLTLIRLEILRLMVQGYNNKEIAKIMDLSESNFKIQKWRLYCYLGVHNSKDAILIGRKNGYI